MHINKIVHMSKKDVEPYYKIQFNMFMNLTKNIKNHQKENMENNF